MENNLEKFAEELELIKDDSIRKLTGECLLNAPLYFWYKPASSTGKYHSKEENGEGGLIVHTKRVCRTGEFLIEAWPGEVERDVVRSSDILHDIKKYGDGMSGGQWTVKNHPQLAADYVKKINETVGCPKGTLIENAIRAHMGKWGPFPLDTPEKLIVHLADYLGTKFYE